MKIILKKKNLIKLIKKEKNLGFVPTMGSIHDGHASLIKKSISQCNKTIVSIFVNRPQFNRKIDYKNYPINFKKDIYLLKKLKVDFLYIPKELEIYNDGFSKNLKISKFSKKLCGKTRPGHFYAVVDVVDRFIKIINPKKIFLGNKDMQQLKILEEFIKKNHPNTQIIGCKTIREQGGIAYSSRNLLLSNEEKIIASKVYYLLKNTKKKILLKKKNLIFLKRKVKKLGVKKIAYIELVDINRATQPFKINKLYKIFIAFYLGSTRLIDNI